MGNALFLPFFGQSVYIPAEEPETVRFDLRGMGSAFRYALGPEGEPLEGTFELPYDLGVQSVKLDDPVELARSAVVRTAGLPVGVERAHRLKSPGQVGPKGEVEKLVSGGVVVGEDSEEGAWRLAGRIDSEMGTILVYAKISREVRTLMRLDTKNVKSGWFDRGGPGLVGRAEGRVEMWVKARFETEADRQLAAVKGFAVGVVAVASVVALGFVRKHFLKYTTKCYRGKR